MKITVKIDNKYLCDLMEKEKVSQEKLAMGCGITIREVNEFLCGKSIPQNSIKAIADYFDIPANKLVKVDYQLTEDEEDLLLIYNALNDEGQARIIRVIEEEYERYHSLNDEWLRRGYYRRIDKELKEKISRILAEDSRLYDESDKYPLAERILEEKSSRRAYELLIYEQEGRVHIDYPFLEQLERLVEGE